MTDVSGSLSADNLSYDIILYYNNISFYRSCDYESIIIFNQPAATI